MSTCHRCQAELNPEVIFCPSCGLRQPQHVVSERKYYGSIIQFITFYFLLTVPLLLMRLPVLQGLWRVDIEGEITVDLAMEVYMIVLIVVFSLLGWRRMAPLLSFRRVRLPMLGLVALVAIAYALLVYYSMGALVDAANLEHENLNYLQDKPLSVFVVVIVIMAVIPGIFEELAFRGFLLTQLQSYVSYSAAALVTSILFFFIHFAFISIFWMLPFALAMCYLRLRTGTLWYGIVWHFVHNSTVTLLVIWLA